MKRIFKPVIAAFMVAASLTACKKEAADVISNEGKQQEISQEVLGKIKSLGFGTKQVQKVEDGYLVEGDIVLTEEQLNNKPESTFLRIGDEEQYRTTNIVGYLPRTVTIRVSTALPYSYVAAVDAAIQRYNNLQLKIKFARVTSGGNIIVEPAPAGSSYLASAGFPIYGHPYPKVRVNTGALNTWNANTKTTIMAHEIGHCIGFRHTDYMNRSYSCGGTAVNEGYGEYGAHHIPGTPTGPNAGSWMLACIGNGTDRPFTYYDKVALNYLY